jgi:hypothetical protein
MLQLGFGRAIGESRQHHGVRLTPPRDRIRREERLAPTKTTGL